MLSSQPWRYCTGMIALQARGIRKPIATYDCHFLSLPALLPKLLCCWPFCVQICSHPSLLAGIVTKKSKESKENDHRRIMAKRHQGCLTKFWGMSFMKPRLSSSALTKSGSTWSTSKALDTTWLSRIPSLQTKQSKVFREGKSHEGCTETKIFVCAQSCMYVHSNSNRLHSAPPWRKPKRTFVFESRLGGRPYGLKWFGLAAIDCVVNCWSTRFCKVSEFWHRENWGPLFAEAFSSKSVTRSCWKNDRRVKIFVGYSCWSCILPAKLIIARGQSMYDQTQCGTWKCFNA